MASGIQDIPLRIPERWDPVWFEALIREVLAKADIRNAIEGAGITIDGQSDVPATVSSSEDLLDLKEQAYILAISSSFLNNERILQGETDVVSTTDDGPGGDFTIGIENGGITNLKLRQSQELSVIGRPKTGVGPPQDILSSANDTVLRRVNGTFGDMLEFGGLTVDMAADELWTYAKLQDATARSVLGRASGTSGVLADIASSADDQFFVRRAGALTWDTIQDADVPASIARDTEVTAAISALNLASGVYTPTLTNVANLDASTAFQCQYMRVGSVVTVSGRVSVDPTAGATSTQLGISLPVASDFGATEDCGGTAAAQGIAGQCAAIIADVTNNRAQMQFISGDVTNQGMSFIFQYRII